MQNKPDKQNSPSILQVVSSVLAAAFGVQSRKNSERDFTTGKPLVFVIVGLIFTILFVLAIVSVVSLVLSP